MRLGMLGIIISKELVDFIKVSVMNRQIREMSSYLDPIVRKAIE
jgi:hypothetical protein